MSSSSNGFDESGDLPDEVIHRLQRMNWSDVDPEMRDRCWEDFKRQLAEGKGARFESTPAERQARTRERQARQRERLEFTRPQLAIGGQFVVAGRAAAARAPMRRSLQRPAFMLG